MSTTCSLFTDFNQFIVFDADADWDDLDERWTDDALEDMYAVGPGYVGVGTARAFRAPVTVRLEGESLEEPSMKPDRTVTLPLAIPSGTLVVSGVTDGGASGGEISVSPGDYDLTIDYVGLDTVDEQGVNGDDRYILTLGKRR